jgi:ABC-type sugar transport system substrate-binding protein
MRVRSLLSRKAMPVSRKAALGALALGGAMLASASAFAQAAGGTIGAQIGTMSQEFSTAGGTAASTAMYVGALITFVFRAWLNRSGLIGGSNS